MIRTRLRAARLFHPMSEFGRTALKSAMATQAEYEKRIGPLVTVVTENAISKFSPLLDQDIKEQRSALNKQRVQAIKNNSKYYAAELDDWASSQTICSKNRKR